MKKIVYTIILFSFFACNENPVKSPDNLLDEEVMVDILYDIAILQAADGYVPEKLILSKIQTNSFIYDKYKIDSTTYYQNHKYYAADVKKYKKMYTKVIERINSKMKELEDPIPAIEGVENTSKAIDDIPEVN